MKGRFFLLSGSTEPITGPAPDPVAQDDAASASEKKLRIVDALRLGPWIGTLEHGGFVLVRLDPMFRACEESEWTPTDSSWAWDRRMRQGTERARLATVDTRNRSAWDAEVEYNHNIELEVQPFNRNERSYVYTELHGGTTGQAVELGRGPRRIDTGGVIISDQHRAIAMALSVDPERSEVEVLMLNDTFWIYLAETLGLDGGMNFDEVDLDEVDFDEFDFYERLRVTTLWTHLELR